MAHLDDDREQFIHMPFVTITGRLGCVTAAVKLLSQDENEKVLSVGLSFCSPKDSWDRKKGNKIASARRERGRNFSGELVVPSDITEKGLHGVLRQHLVSPKWSKTNKEKMELPRWMNFEVATKQFFNVPSFKMGENHQPLFVSKYKEF